MLPPKKDLPDYYELIKVSSHISNLNCFSYMSKKALRMAPLKIIWNYIIQRPVDIQKIRNRIRKENYRNLEDLESDVMLMCANTQQYNIDGSLVSPKTKVLKKSDFFLDFRRQCYSSICFHISKTNVTKKWPASKCYNNKKLRVLELSCVHIAPPLLSSSTTL